MLHREAASGPAARATLLPWLSGTVLLAITVLVLVLVAGGGAPQPVPRGLPDPGVLTAWGLPVVRLLVDGVGFAVVGLALVGSRVVNAGLDRPTATDAMAEDALRLAARAAAVWALLAVTQGVLVVSELLALPVTTLDGADWQRLLGALASAPDARALVAQGVLAGSVAWFAGLARGVGGATVALGLAVAAWLPPALVGHVATSSGALGSAALAGHVAAAALWVGGLGALAWLTLRAETRGAAARAVSRYSAVALACVVAVAVSGVLSAAGAGVAVEALFTSAYGAVLLAKLGALLLLGGCGWLHRRRTVERMRLTGASRRRTRGRLGNDALPGFLALASFELLLMAATLALAVGLSRTPPPSAGGDADAAVSAPTVWTMFVTT